MGLPSTVVGPTGSPGATGGTGPMGVPSTVVGPTGSPGVTGLPGPPGENSTSGVFDGGTPASSYTGEAMFDFGGIV